MDVRLDPIIAAQPYPLVFLTVSGAHLYGFPSPDSDYDLRGTHVVPACEALGLHARQDTIEVSTVEQGLEVDLVTHDLAKFMAMMLKKNGYVLEQLLSPIVLRTTEAHRELIELSRQCLTRFHAHHYLGFAQTQWKLFAKEERPRVKPLLYTYRVLLTGIHLMRAHVVEANLVHLNEVYRLGYISDLIARKLGGPEQGTLDAADMPFHEAEYRRLVSCLEQEMNESTLPELPTAQAGLSDLLVRLRLATL